MVERKEEESTDTAALEVLHYTGGHCGIFTGWKDAIEYAARYLYGMPLTSELCRGYNQEIIVPRSTKPVSHWITPAKVTAVVLSAKVHTCNCALCPVPGGTIFYAVHAETREAF